MSALNASTRFRAALAAFRKPDLEDPTPLDADAPVRVDPIAMTHRHKHVACTKGETWAFFRLNAVDWFGLPAKKHDAHLRAVAHRLADLADLDVTRVWLRCIQQPMPLDKMLERVEAMAPGIVLTPHEWAETQMRVSALIEDVHHASRPMIVLGVKVADYATNREHMPILMQDRRAPDPLGKVEATRVTLASVTATLSLEGLSAEPLTSETLRWVLDKSVGLGLPDPVGAAGEVEPVADYYGDWTELHRMDARGTVSGNVQVLHVTSTLEDFDTDDDVTPWLGWLSNARLHATRQDGKPTTPIHIEWASMIDLSPGAAVARKIRERDLRNRNTTEGNPDTDEQRSLERGEESAGETKYGSRDVAVRGDMVTVVAVAALYDADGQAVQAAAARVVSGAAKKHIELTRRPRQYADLRRFIPCEPWGDLSAVGDKSAQTGYSVAAAVPHMRMGAGDNAGWPVGPIHDSREFLLLDPWGGIKANRPNMAAVVGEPGSAKTSSVAAIIKWSVEQGHRVFVSSADPMITRLAGVSTLAPHTKVIELGTDATPGILMPGFLVPDRDPSVFDTDAEREKARVSDESDRISLTTDLAVSCLPWQDQQNPDVVRVVTRAVQSVAGAYGFQASDVYDAIRAEAPGRFSDGIVADLKATPTVWPSRDVDEAMIKRVAGDARLTIVTTAGIETPPKGSTNRASWTTRQHQSVPILLGAARLAARGLWADRSLKMYVSDETGITTGGLSSYSSFLTRLGMDSRKWGVSSWLIFQTMAALLALDPNIASLFGAALIFRTESANAAAALALTRLTPGAGWENQIEEQATGGFLLSDWQRRVRWTHVDRAWHPDDLIEATDTTPAVPVSELVGAGGMTW